VNQAQAILFPGGPIALRTAAVTNPTGGFNNSTATGNKAIFGVHGYDGTPIADMLSVDVIWENYLGNGGPFYIPPTSGDSTSPSGVFFVDFDGAGDLRVCFLIGDTFVTAVRDAVGSYTNDGSNQLTYHWDNTMSVAIANAPPNPVPGGVSPSVNVGSNWFERAYAWSDLVAANPNAVIRDAFPANAAYFALGDAGFASGAYMPGISILSGSTSTLSRNGKLIVSAAVNGASIF